VLTAVLVTEQKPSTGCVVRDWLKKEFQEGFLPMLSVRQHLQPQYLSSLVAIAKVIMHGLGTPGSEEALNKVQEALDMYRHISEEAAQKAAAAER
jgi:hypothetical protein